MAHAFRVLLDVSVTNLSVRILMMSILELLVL